MEIVDILKRRGIEKFEIYYEEIETHPVLFLQNVLQSLEVKRESGIGIRIIKDGKIGFSSTNDLSNPEEVLDFAIASSRFGEKIEFDFPSRTSYKEVEIFDPTGWDIKERIKLGDVLLKEIGKFGDVQTDIELSFSTRRIRIMNSSGLDISYEKTLYSIEVEGLTLLPTGITWIYESKVSTKPIEKTEEIIENLKRKLKWAEKLAEVKSGYFPVILAPQVSISLIGAFLLGVQGKNVAKGISPLTGRIGEKILDDRVTFWDDALYPGLLRSRPFDDEGVPTEKKPFIEKGTLKTYLLDLHSASQLGLNSTGNAVRSYQSQPSPGLNNLIMDMGDRSLEDIIKDTEYGLLVCNDIGGGQSNLLAGDFSLNVGLGYLIERGEIVGRVKDTMISGNVYEVFREVIALSKEREIFWNYVLPHIKLGGIKITSKS
jgi:PmbA protein